MTTMNPTTDDATAPTIEDVLDAFLQEREHGNYSRATYHNNKGHLDQFGGWCEDQGLVRMDEITPQTLLSYKLSMKKDREKNEMTVYNYFSTVRTFLKWSNRYNYCDENLVTAMQSDDFKNIQSARERMIPVEQAKAVMAYLRKYKYATTHHVMFEVFWHTGCRRAALCGLDLDDWKPVRDRENGRYGLLDFKHRPETETPLKNEEDGEREVMVWPKHGGVIQDYIDTHREKKTDDYGREPLLTSQKGRYRPDSIQPVVNAMTRPCKAGMECPVGRDPEGCEATYFDHAAKCPDSYSPHPFRRAAITYHLEEKDWTDAGVSGRFDVSVKTLKKHYDQSTTEGRRKTRAAMFFSDDE